MLIAHGMLVVRIGVVATSDVTQEECSPTCWVGFAVLSTAGLPLGELKYEMHLGLRLKVSSSFSESRKDRKHIRPAFGFALRWLMSVLRRLISEVGDVSWEMMTSVLRSLFRHRQHVRWCSCARRLQCKCTCPTRALRWSRWVPRCDHARGRHCLCICASTRPFTAYGCVE